MKIVVLGAGAVGSLWASSLAQAGHEVMLWLKSSIPMANYPITLNETNTYYFSCNQVEKLAQAELVLVCVKAWQVESALMPLLPWLNSNSTLLFIHNGMGALDSLQAPLSNFSILLATTTQAALLTQRQQVIHTGQGHTYLGSLSSSNMNHQKSQWVELLDQALPSVSWHPQIEQALWQKLAINCVINPLTALHQIPNGDLAQPQFVPIINALIKELFAVMHAKQLPITQPQLTQQIQQVIHATAANRSSMCQDIAHHRQTEIDFITGYLLKQAHSLGIKVPTHQQLYQRIIELEKKDS